MWRKRNLTGRHLVALADGGRYVGADFLDREIERLEHARGQPLLLTQEAEEDVLGTDVVVLERARLVLREDDHLAGALGEALEHALQPTPSNRLLLGVLPALRSGA